MAPNDYLQDSIGLGAQHIADSLIECNSMPCEGETREAGLLRAMALITALMPAAIGSSASAAEFVGTGKPGRWPLLMLRWEARADMERIIELHRQGDKEAANVFIERRVPACRPLDAGTVGVVEERTIVPPQLACLRPNGEPACLWLPANTVGKP